MDTNPIDLNRIMEPLYSTKARGLGLGLALSQLADQDFFLANQLLPRIQGINQLHHPRIDSFDIHAGERQLANV